MSGLGLTIIVSPQNCTVTPGGSCEVEVQIIRSSEGIGPIEVHTESASADVSGSTTTLAADVSTALITLTASPTADAVEHVEVVIVAHAEDLQARASVDVAILESAKLAAHASPANVTISRGASTSIELTASLTEGTDLSVQSQVPGVVTTIEPSAAGVFLVRLHATIDAPLGVGTLVLLAENGSMAVLVEVDIDVQALEIAGVVRNGMRQPMAGMTVHVPGAGSTTTDTAGHFSLANVPVPFDLVLLNGSKTIVTVYEQLRAKSVDAVAFVGSPADLRSATVSGSLTGGTGTVSPSSTVILGVLRGKTSTISANPSYSSAISWQADLSTSVSVHAYQTDGPQNYTGYGKAVDVTVDDAGTTGALDINMGTAPPAVSSVASDVAGPGVGFTIQQQLWVSWADGASKQLWFASASSTSFVLPQFPNAHLSLVAVAQEASSGTKSMLIEHLAAPQTSATLSMPPPATLIEPLANTTGIGPGSAFSWTTGDGSGASLFVLRNNAAQRVVAIVTASASVTLPSLDELGFALPSASAMQWSVWEPQGNSSPTELVQSGGLADFFFGFDQLLPAHLPVGHYQFGTNALGSSVSERRALTSL